MGNGSIPIDKVTLAIAGGILTVAAALLGWLARTFFKRMDRDKDEVIALIKDSGKRMDRDKDEVIALIKDSDKRMGRDKDEVIALIKDSETRSGEKFQAINGQLEKLDGKVETLRGETRDSLKDVDKKIDLTRKELDLTRKELDGTRKELNSTRKELDKKGEKRHGETQDALQKLNRKIEKRHRETLNTLINLTLQGGRHEGPGRVKDDSAARLGQHSPRRNDAPSSTRDVEADPEQDAVHTNIAMVPVAGVGTEPAHAPGLAHQAAPSPKQAPQRVDETGTEPDAAESAETAP